MRPTWDPTVPAIILAGAMVAGVILATGGLSPGDWRATPPSGGATVRLEICLGEGGRHVRITTDVPTGELTGYDAESFGKSGAPVRLAWKREAGSFLLEGKGGMRPSGAVRFEPATEFREGWQGMGLEPLAEDDLLMMAISGVRLADVQRIKASGIEDLDASSVSDLARDPEAMRWVTALQGRAAPLRLRDIFKLRNRGLRPETFRDYEESGVEADVEGIVRLHDRSVDPGYVTAVVQAGVGARDVDGIVRLHDHSVSAEYAAGIRASGLRDAGVDDIVRLHDQGIDVDYVRGLTASPLEGITLDGIVRLHAHSVSVDYVRAVAEYGPGDRAVDDAIRLHDSGVSTEFMRVRATDGTARPSTEGTIRSWTRGGDPSQPTP